MLYGRLHLNRLLSRLKSLTIQIFMGRYLETAYFRYSRGSNYVAFYLEVTCYSKCMRMHFEKENTIAFLNEVTLHRDLHAFCQPS